MGDAIDLARIKAKHFNESNGQKNLGVIREFEELCEQIGVKDENVTREVIVKVLSECNWDKLEAMDILLNNQHISEPSSNQQDNDCSGGDGLPSSVRDQDQ